jgi:hypothetical protein
MILKDNMTWRKIKRIIKEEIVKSGKNNLNLLPCGWDI